MIPDAHPRLSTGSAPRARRCRPGARRDAARTSAPAEALS